MTKVKKKTRDVDVPYASGQQLANIGITGRDMNPLGIYTANEDGYMVEVDYVDPDGGRRTLADGSIFELLERHPERFEVTDTIAPISTEASGCINVDRSGNYSNALSAITTIFAGAKERRNIDERLRCNWIREQEREYNEQNGISMRVPASARFGQVSRPTTINGRAVEETGREGNCIDTNKNLGSRMAGIFGRRPAVAPICANK